MSGNYALYPSIVMSYAINKLYGDDQAVPFMFGDGIITAKHADMVWYTHGNGNDLIRSALSPYDLLPWWEQVRIQALETFGGNSLYSLHLKAVDKNRFGLFMTQDHSFGNVLFIIKDDKAIDKFDDIVVFTSTLVKHTG
jgi:hypothetical protein